MNIITDIALCLIFCCTIVTLLAGMRYYHTRSVARGCGIGILGSCFFFTVSHFSSNLIGRCGVRHRLRHVLRASPTDFKGSYLPFQWRYGPKNVHVFESPYGEQTAKCF